MTQIFVGRTAGAAPSAACRRRSYAASLAAVAISVVAAPCAGAAPDPLPAGYAYERVNPEQTRGQNFTGSSLAPSEDRVLGISPGGFAGVENLPDSGITYLTSRTGDGWLTSAIAPPASSFPFIGSGMIDSTDDLLTTLWRANLREDKATERFTPIVRHADGTFAAAGPTFDDTGKSISSFPLGTSADLSTLVVVTGLRNIVTDGTTQTRSAAANDLVVVRPDGAGSFDVRALAYRAGATMLPNCSVRLGNKTAHGAVSASGDQVIFSFSGLGSCLAPANQRVWAKIGNDAPVDLSASLCTTTCGVAAAAQFEGASRDGSRVYFTTDQKLLDGDQDTTLRRDLYEYDHDATGTKLRSVTSSALPDGAGVVGVSTVSEDGTAVSFVANGRPLTMSPNERGLTPQVGDNNLYVYRRSAGAVTGTISFVGPVTSDDASPLIQFSLLSNGERRAFSTTDGRFLLFTSYANLTGERLPGDTHADLYRYDAASDELLRIWTDDPAHNGNARTAGPIVSPPSTGGSYQSKWHGGWPISEDGKTVAFDTTERLSPGDTNQEADAYMWQEDTDRLTMLSDGSSVVPARYAAVSKSGNTVLFTSTAPLTKSHTSGALGLFAARRGGGFPDPPEPPPVCVDDGCQGPADPLPPFQPVGGLVPGASNLSIVAPTVTVSGAKTIKGTRATVKVGTSASGRITVSGSRLRTVERTVSKAGSYSVSVGLRASGRRALASGKRVRAKVKVRVAALTGGSTVKAVTVTFRPKKPKAKSRRSSASKSSAKAGK